MPCTYRASDYFYVMLKLKGNASYALFITIVDHHHHVIFQDQDNSSTVIVECHGRYLNRSFTNMLERLHFQSSKDYNHDVLRMRCISLYMLV